MPTFDTPRPITATLELIAADVRIAASDRPDTVVDVRPSNPASDSDVRAAEQTRVEYADGALLVKTPKPRSLGMFGRTGAIDVQIAVPTGSRLHAGAAVGAFHCTGTLGETRIKTATGDVRLEHTGPLHLDTASGTIVVQSADGDTHASTASGSLHVGAVRGSAVVRNSNGDSRVDWVAGDVNVKAANGDIIVGHADGDLVASTANGSVRVEEVVRGTVSVQTAVGELQVGVARGTAAYLDLHTSFGKVLNQLSEGGAAEPGEDKVEVRARTSFGNIAIVRAPGREAA
ncbi:DUF4097 family beta strand repeat-containing protein [Actinoplanes sp. NPDC049316]|uniref:DUF4097 family beta strand repeat-containing protein n=1 Tax=Actinoplanes sp. NPDC049316 TaxID=3154727 RepID=UPI003444F7F7